VTESLERRRLLAALMSIEGSLSLLEAGAAGPLPLVAKELLGIAARNCERLIHVLSAVDRDVGAGDKGRLIRS
jgi:hypothetical protein